MSILKKEFVSKDKKLNFEVLYSQKELWLDITQLSDMFQKEQDEINLMIDNILAKKKSKKLLPKEYVYFKDKTKIFYNTRLIKKLNKKYKSKYCKQFLWWSIKPIFYIDLLEKYAKILTSFTKTKSFINCLVFIILSISASVGYYFINKNIGEMDDISLTLFGITFSIIAFTIPTLLNLIKSYNEKIYKKIKSKDSFDNLEAKLTIKLADFLIKEKLFAIGISIICVSVSLIFNIDIIWKNTLSIFSFLLTLFSLLHIVVQIYSKQKEMLKTLKKQDTNSLEEIEKEITKWIN